MISFIVPTRNEEKALPGTLACLAKFDGAHEIVVADNGSADKTIEIARRYTKNIVEFMDKDRITIGALRNAGAAKAKGGYFVFADADTYVKNPNDFFEKAEAFFRKDPKLVSLGFFHRITPSVATIGDRIFLPYFNWATMILNLVGFGTSFGKLYMIRADAFMRVGGYQPQLAMSEDYDLFHRLAKIGRTRFTRSLVVYHSGRRQHAIGWPRLIWQWAANTTSAFFFKKSYHDEWKVIR